MDLRNDGKIPLPPGGAGYDLVIGLDVLAKALLRVRPFAQTVEFLDEVEYQREVARATLLERIAPAEPGKARNLGAAEGFAIYDVADLPWVVPAVPGTTPLTGDLGLRNGSLVYRIEDSGPRAGFETLPFQTVLLDGALGELYAADPVPGWVPPLYSLLRRPMRFRDGDLFVQGCGDRALLNVENLPPGAFPAFAFTPSRLRAILRRGSVKVELADGAKIALPLDRTLYLRFRR